MTLELNKIHQGDCIELLNQIPDKSIDMVLCDLPYGITECRWDSVIPIDKLWEHYKRIVKDVGAIVLTSSQPFTSFLVMSNPKMFKHEWVWIKSRGSNFANTVREPMKEHENVLVFSYGKWKYNKQMQERTGGGLERAKYLVKHNSQNRESTRQFEGRKHHEMSSERVPSSWQKFNNEVGLHPTQKPVLLFQYLIKTYSDEGDTILDNCMGSGTTALACIKTKRNFIGIELEKKYCDVASERLNLSQKTIGGYSAFLP